MTFETYNNALKRLQNAVEILFCVLIREPHHAVVSSSKINRLWFDFAPFAIRAAVKNFFEQIDRKESFSMHSASEPSVSMEDWVLLLQKAGDVTFDAAVVDVVDAIGCYIEQQIALNVLGKWASLRPDEIRSEADAMRDKFKISADERISDNFDEWFEAKIQGGMPQYPCYMPIKCMQPYIRHFEPGSMTVIAARPSVGKTYFLLNLMLPWLLDGLNGFLVSLDMSTTMLKSRVLGMLTGINPRADWSMLSLEDISVLQKERERMRELNLEIVDGVSDVGVLERLISASHARRTLDFIAVDHLQLMSARGAQNRYQMITEISARLKLMAKSLRIPILAVSQLSRASEARSNSIPRLSDLRESGAIEQDATYVIALHRQKDEISGAEDTPFVTILKSQNGPVCGIMKMQFHPVFGWSDADDIAPPPPTVDIGAPSNNLQEVPF